MNYSLLPILPAVYDILFNFAQSDGFWANWETAFGANYDVVAQINQNDTPSDEGEYFSTLVRGQSLTAQEIARITTENDWASITV
jgi:hypothetical protein